MSRLEEIETFVAVVDAGSLTGAARATGLALSAVSRRIKDLETRLGTTLLRRTTRRMNLTDDGRAFHQRCREILADLAEAEAVVASAAVGYRGRIRLTAPTTFAVKHLDGLLVGFVRAYPEVRLEVDLSDRRVDLLEEGVDLAIRVGRLADSTLVARRLAPIRHLPCIAPALLAEIGPFARPEDLARAPILAYRTRGEAVRWGFSRPDGARGEGVAPARVQCNNGDMIAALAEAGLGVAVEPTFVMADAILAGRLVPLFADHAWSNDAVYAVWPQGRALPRRVRALIDHIAAALTPDPPWDRALAEHIAGFPPAHIFG